MYSCGENIPQVSRIHYDTMEWASPVFVRGDSNHNGTINAYDEMETYRMIRGSNDVIFSPEELQDNIITYAELCMGRERWRIRNEAQGSPSLTCQEFMSRIGTPIGGLYNADPNLQQVAAQTLIRQLWLNDDTLPLNAFIPHMLAVVADSGYTNTALLNWFAVLRARIYDPLLVIARDSELYPDPIQGAAIMLLGAIDSEVPIARPLVSIVTRDPTMARSAVASLLEIIRRNGQVLPEEQSQDQRLSSQQREVLLESAFQGLVDLAVLPGLSDEDRCFALRGIRSSQSYANSVVRENHLYSYAGRPLVQLLAGNDTGSSQHNEPMVRREAVLALGYPLNVPGLADTRNRALETALRTDTDSGVRAAALIAIGMLNPNRGADLATEIIERNNAAGDQ